MTVTTTEGRVGLIGCGIIADVRVPALRAAGLDVVGVSTRAGSTKVREFATKHEIGRVYEDWRQMLTDADAFDAFVVSTWPDGTPDVLLGAMPLGKPILVEKPVAWNSATHRKLLAQPHDNVIVGYNRRFYRSVQEARCELLDGPPVVAALTVPTEVPTPDEPDPSGRYMQQFYESVSALGLDLTRYVLGDLRVDAVRRLTNEAGNVVALAALLSTPRGDLLQLTCNWRTPSNYSLVLNRPGRRLELLPFEIATVYDSMEVVQPTDDYPVRRYMPKPGRRVALDGVDLQQKPGFVGEALALRAMIGGSPPPEFAARLEDAAAVTALCEALTGVTLGDVNPSTYHH